MGHVKDTMRAFMRKVKEGMGLENVVINTSTTFAELASIPAVVLHDFTFFPNYFYRSDWWRGEMIKNAANYRWHAQHPPAHYDIRFAVWFLDNSQVRVLDMWENFVASWGRSPWLVVEYQDFPLVNFMDPGDLPVRFEYDIDIGTNVGGLEGAENLSNVKTLSIDAAIAGVKIYDGLVLEGRLVKYREFDMADMERNIIEVFEPDA